MKPEQAHLNVVRLGLCPLSPSDHVGTGGGIPALQARVPALEAAVATLQTNLAAANAAIAIPSGTGGGGGQPC